jgi:hypothetical protein
VDAEEEFPGLAFADPEPWIIRALRITQRRAVGAGEPAWVAAYLKSILEDWDHKENLNQLKVDLGLVFTRKRRTVRTVQRESKLAIACVEAAFAGATNPVKAAADKLQEDIKQIQRAWKTWGPFHLGILRSYLSLNDSIPLKPSREEINAAIKRLSQRQDKKS